MKLSVYRGAAMALMGVLAGCVQNPYTEQTDPGNQKPLSRSEAVPSMSKKSVTNKVESTLKPTFARKQFKTNPAVLALIDQARMSDYNGDYQSAEVSLERALRISPKNIRLYRLMVELKIHKNDLQSAAEIARKGLSIASGRNQFEEQRQLQSLLAKIVQE